MLQQLELSFQQDMVDQARFTALVIANQGQRGGRFISHIFLIVTLWFEGSALPVRHGLRPSAQL